MDFSISPRLVRLKIKVFKKEFLLWIHDYSSCLQHMFLCTFIIIKVAFLTCPQPVQTSVMWAWWDTTSYLKALMCWTTMAKWWDPQRLLQDMWGFFFLHTTLLHWICSAGLFPWIANVLVADNGKTHNFMHGSCHSAPILYSLSSAHIWFHEIKSNSFAEFEMKRVHNVLIFTPGDHGDRLHTRGPPDANLHPAPHHHVLPREVCTDIMWLDLLLGLQLTIQLGIC